jgi:hypothetical protein
VAAVGVKICKTWKKIDEEAETDLGSASYVLLVREDQKRKDLVGMKNDGREVRRISGHSNEPAIQVICLVSLSQISCILKGLLDH